MPAVSVALKVTVVVPSGKVSGALFVMVSVVSTLSVAVAALRKLVIAATLAAIPFASVAAIMILAGAVTTGGVTSVMTLTTVIVTASESLATGTPLSETVKFNG